MPDFSATLLGLTASVAYARALEPRSDLKFQIAPNKPLLGMPALKN
jgi:hypothetical protein